jgi:integrase
VILRWPIPERRETLGDLPIGAVDNALLERFYKAQVAAGKSVGHRNKMVQLLRHFSRWAVREGYRTTAWLEPDDPSHSVRVRQSAQRHRRLALPLHDAHGRLLVAGEFERLLAVADPRLRDLCIATMELGARLAELTRLRWQDVDLTRGTVTIRDSKDPAGQKKRVLPLSATLRPVLEARRLGPDDKPHAPDACVFGNAVGESAGRSAVLKAWENAVLRAHGHDVTVGVGRDARSHSLTPAARKAYRAIDLVFHDLRHEAASQWLESGAVRLTTIMFLLGHSKLETTQIYLNVRPEGVTDELAAFARGKTEVAGKSGPQVAHDARNQSAPRLVLTPKNGRKSRRSLELA